METFSLIVVALVSAVAIALVLVLVAGVCALCGVGSFAHVFVHGLWAMLLIPAVMVYGGLIERNIFRVKEVNIPCDKLPEAFDGYRIVQISDLHLRSFAGRESALKRAVEKINALDADLICFSGDLVTMESSEIEPFREILSSLKARNGVISVMGNHLPAPHRRLPGNHSPEPAKQTLSQNNEHSITTVMIQKTANRISPGSPLILEIVKIYCSTWTKRS